MARQVKEREIEVLPEADRLEGFAHPRETADLVGHAQAQMALRSAFDSGRMHHAWILAGPAGIGKATLAYRFASYVLASAADRAAADPGSLAIPADTTAVRQVRALSHPRLLVIRRPYDVKAKRFSASIPVDAVRAIRGFLSSRGEAGDWRVVIVDTADELNVNAANALLKSLEEPPARTIFLLVSSEPGRLLNTIRSRCRRLALAPLARGDLRRAVDLAVAAGEGEALDTAAFDALEPLAGGSVRRLLSLHALDGDRLAGQIRDILGRLPQVSWDRVHALGDELAPASAAERYEVFFDLMSSGVRNGVRLAAGGSLNGVTDGRAHLVPPESLVRLIGSRGGPAAWADTWEATVAERADVATLNLDRKAFIVEAVGRLARMAAAG